MGYYLMVKYAIVNGKPLGYLCKMKNDGRDPYKYPGSGVLWTRYLNKYKPKVETIILGLYDTQQELRDIGILMSKIFNVVESNKWANLIPEIGDGGSTTKGKLRCYNPVTKEERLLDAVPEGWVRGSQYTSSKNSVVYHNLKTGKLKRFREGQEIPPEWVRGGIKGKYNYGPKRGSKAYYDPVTRKKVIIKDTSNVPKNLVKGICYTSTKDRIGFYNAQTKKKRYFKSTDTVHEGWIKGIPPTTGKRIITPHGEFNSVSDAMKTLDLSREDIQKNIRLGEKDWAYL